MSQPFNQIYPNQAIAVCTREQAEQLVNYDHHVVSANRRLGVMLTYEWMPVEDHASPFVLCSTMPRNIHARPKKFNPLWTGLGFRSAGSRAEGLIPKAVEESTLRRGGTKCT